MKMTENNILNEVALLCEKAYRRGFQHGVHHSLTSQVDVETAGKYRYDVPLNKPYGAPERDADGLLHKHWNTANMTLLDRHFGCECRDEDCPELMKLYRRRNAD